MIGAAQFAAAVAALHLILVHAPDGQMIEVNPHEISSIREPRESEGHFQKNVNCVLWMTNGKFIGVVEECDAILDMIAKVPD